jgi:G3E family GTPase
LLSSTVTSVGITVEGNCDFRKLNRWLSNLLSTKGNDIFRSKGILCVEGSKDKVIIVLLFDAVHTGHRDYSHSSRRFIIYA